MSSSDKDRAFVWHPFTQMQEWCDDEQLMIVRGEGCELTDSQGRTYLDAISSLWVNVHGHGNRSIGDAIKAQIDRVSHSTLFGLANVPAAELAERLIQVSPRGLSKVFYAETGAVAVETALKMSFSYQIRTGHPERNKFLALTNAYHGETLGAYALCGFPTIDPFRSILMPVLRTEPSIEALARVFDRHGAELAAFVLEPLVQGAAGMLLQPPGFLSAARELCTKYGVLLVADEVSTGFGRTGKMFASMHEDVAPDIMCLAKGMSGGYLPLGAAVTTEEVYGAFLGRYADLKAFYHGGTYAGNPLACAAGLASLDVFENERVLERLEPKISHFQARLQESIAGLSHVFEVRQRGFMVGIELIRDKRNRAPYPLEEAIGYRVCKALRAHRVIMRPLVSVLVMMPPLSTTERQIDHLVDATRSAIIDVCGAN